MLLVFIFSRFRPAPTQKIADNIFAVRCGFVNFYALKTADSVVLFDTGMNPAVAGRGLRKLGISPDLVTHVFLTHTDYDHTGGLTAFPQAKRYLSAGEEQMINGETARRGFMHNKPFLPYHTMADCETIVVGGVSIKLHLVPGHTPGSAAYLIDNRILVTGDLLRLSRKGGFLPFLWMMNMNHRQDMQSVEAIRPIAESAEYILTGHTGLYHKE
ncbi:MBL fold metallo-hydrolase [Anaerocolumna sedimenticola]|uniref:MBL fold metallo-hydrolase n=1 Tax=Anaerocolumna sedimenticola TaxID=2696063 RepID=A0A6P1TV63_9FIRM|nr:MBL fold metallo-hydrolase [Anaerocolumna sedimenticola]QHQ63378.1 MBL fold metallo-hydrolase [Anaerocolumna sedimenticola]